MPVFGGQVLCQGNQNHLLHSTTIDLEFIC
jgi:hypothetical protein